MFHLSNFYVHTKRNLKWYSLQTSLTNFIIIQKYNNDDELHGSHKIFNVITQIIASSFKYELMLTC